MESRYTQLYQSINAGHPINRLRRLHEILPQIKPTYVPTSTPTPRPVHAHGRKASVDLSALRSRRWKTDKYRFVDKVEESSCIWDLDHMEAKATAQAAAEAAAIAKQSVVASSRHGSQHNLDSIGSPSPQDVGRQQLSSASTDSLGLGKASLSDTNPPPVVFSHQPQCDSPLAVMDANGVSMGLSPSSTFSSLANLHHVNDSTTNSSLSLDRPSPKHQKEGLGESKLRYSESYPSASHGSLAHTLNSVDSSISFNSNGLEPTIPPPEALASKRNSILGIFGIRGKKFGQDSDQLNTHHEIPPFLTQSQLIELGTTQERRSFDGLQARPNHGLFNPNRRRQSVMELGTTLSRFMNSTTNNTSSPNGTSLEEGIGTGDYVEVSNPGLTDDEYGGHFAPPSQWPQGERMDDSQDESDPATAPHKVLSLSTRMHPTSSCGKSRYSRLIWLCIDST